jgi:valyl-tRNA synthetase
MSKSKGNVIDPLVMAEEYGTDALRFTLAAMAAQGRDIKLSEERIAGYRNFVTKLWNATRLLTMNVSEDFREEEFRASSLEDRWILSRLDNVVRRVNESLESYHYNEAASALYQFAWHEFCDWYLETIKSRLSEEGEDGDLARQVSLYVLRRLLALLHPFMPFVTEEISSRLPGTHGMLVKGPYPEPDERWRDEGAEEHMNLIIEIVNTVRTIRGEMNIKPGLEVDVMVRKLSPEKTAFLGSVSPVIARLARASRLDLGDDPPPKESVTVPISCGELFVPLAGVVDFRAELKRIEKEIARVEKDIVRYEKKLSRKDFLERAPREVVAKDRRVLAESLEKRDYFARSRDRVVSWLED